MRWSICIGCAIIALCACMSGAMAQQPSLSGRVTDGATGQPVHHAVVTLIETGQKTTTDEQGDFHFDLIASGRYTLSIHHVAYATVECPVSSVAGTGRLRVALEAAVLPAQEVIVRSTRTSSSLSATAYPVNVALHDALLRSPVVTLADALQQVPGLALVRDGSWETAIAIRGLSRSNIVTVVDDARLETANDIAGALSLINMHDLERVEVVKSPASAQHGTGAIGGVVQLVSKRASFTDQFQLSGEYTSDLSSVDRGCSQYAAVEATGGRFALRLSGGFREAGDTRTPEGDLENSQFHDFSVSGSLDLAVGAGHSALLTYQRVQANNAGIPGGAPFAASSTAEYTLARRELFGVEYRMPNLSLLVPLLTLRVQRQEIARNVEIGNMNLTTLTPHAVHTTVSAQAEARLTPLPDLLITAGAEGWQRELDSKRERRSGNTVTGERPIPFSRYLSAGLYVLNEWTVIPERLTGTCGARYDWIRVTNDEVMSPEYISTGGVVDTRPSSQRRLWPSGSERDGSWSAHAGLRYTILSGLDITGLISGAFRSPSLEERFEFIDLGSVVYVGNPDLRSEKSTCLNAGIRIQSDGGRVRADAFWNSMSDLVSQVPDVYEGRKALFRANIGSARLYGWELEIERTLTEWSAIEMSIAYVRGEDRYANTDLPQIPPVGGQLAVKGIIDTWGSVVISIPWAGTQGNPGPGESRTPGHAILNAGFSSIPWRLGGMNLTIRTEVRNLLDRAFWNHLSTLRGVVRAEPGRNFVLSATLIY
jgi:hemoglobin/transferrin/lactoferrin receptor protein